MFQKNILEIKKETRIIVSFLILFFVIRLATKFIKTPIPKDQNNRGYHYNIGANA